MVLLYAANSAVAGTYRMTCTSLHPVVATVTTPESNT